MELKREFSWSWSRHRCFEFCRKAYHLRYSVSWQGWDRFSDEMARLAYSLKNLRTVDSWTFQIFRETVRELLFDSHSGRAEFNHVHLKRAALQRLKNEWNEISRTEHDAQPGKIGLSEIYYGGISPDILLDFAADRVFKQVEYFCRSSVFEEISRLEYSSLKDGKNPISFFLNELKIWVAPDFMFNDAKGLNIINLFPDDEMGKDDWPSISGLNVLYASRKLAVQEERINSMSIFSGEEYPESLCVYSYRNIGELSRIAEASSADMREFEKNPVDGAEDVGTGKCQVCEFRRFCLG